MREICQVKSLPKPKFRYNSLIRAGDFYYTAGMIGLDTSGNLAPGGVKAETRAILKSLMGSLEELGMTLDNLVSARIYSVDFNEFPEINREWEAVFEEGIEPPVRTSIGVAALPLGARVEMEFVLYRTR